MHNKVQNMRKNCKLEFFIPLREGEKEREGSPSEITIGVLAM